MVHGGSESSEEDVVSFFEWEEECFSWDDVVSYDVGSVCGYGEEFEDCSE